MTPDARIQYRPDRSYAVQLIDRAQQRAGSRNKLCKALGISRRRLGYIESGIRVCPAGKMHPVEMSFAEQVTLEAFVGG